MTGAARFGPFFAAEGKEGALIALEARYGLTASGIDEASETDTWREIVMQPFPVRPAWGATGLLYGLMLDRLSSKAGALTLVSAAALSYRANAGSDSARGQTVWSISRPAGRRSAGRSDIGKCGHNNDLSAAGILIPFAPSALGTEVIPRTGRVRSHSMRPMTAVENPRNFAVGRVVGRVNDAVDRVNDRDRPQLNAPRDRGKASRVASSEPLTTTSGGSG